MEKCNCGHFKNEHFLAVETDPMNLAGITGKIISAVQLGNGLCKKCTCPKFKSQSRFRPKHIEYPEREIINNESEKRCTRCGRLLSNHAGIDHPFQDKK